MTDGAIPNSPRRETFLRLLTLAFDALAGRDPVVVTTDAELTAHLEHGWESHSSASATDLAQIATHLLQSAPVLLVPSWERLPEPSIEPAESYLRSAYEVAVVRTRSSGPEALLAALLPASALTSPGGRRFREVVDQSWQPRLIIFATGIFPEMHAQFDVAAVFWLPRSSGPQPLTLFRFPRQEDEKAVESDFQGLLARGGGTGKFGFVLTDQPGPGESLSIELHDPVITARWSELHVWGATVPLSSLFTFPAPALHQLADRRQLHDQRRDGSVRVVSGRDLRHDGTVAGPDDSSRWADVAPDRRLRAGDILLRRMFSPLTRGNLVVVEVTADDLPLASADNVVTLRPEAHLDASQRIVAVQFLRSSLVRAHVVGNSVASLTPTMLRDLPVPQPDAALAATLEGLEAARARLETWRNESINLLTSVFDDDSAVVARRRILESGRRLRMRVDAAALLDDFSHQVRTRYPHPVAYRWSEVQVQLSRSAYREAYEAILETSEVLLSYTALALLALSHEEGLSVGAVKGIRSRLSRGGSNGPGFGDWVAILQEAAASKAFRRLPDGHALTDFGRAFSNSATTSARERLAQRRNDKSHLRRVDANDLPTAVNEAHADLTTLLEQTSFLADMPLVHVTGVHWDALRRTAQVEYQELMGDNALVPGKQRSHSSSDLEIGSLYLANEDGRLHLLRPFLLWRRCPMCRRWETFHIDNTPDDSTVTVKSLEQGHADTGPALRQALEQVGFLE